MEIDKTKIIMPHNFSKEARPEDLEISHNPPIPTWVKFEDREPKEDQEIYYRPFGRSGFLPLKYITNNFPGLIEFWTNKSTHDQAIQTWEEHQCIYPGWVMTPEDQTLAQFQFVKDDYTLRFWGESIALHQLPDINIYLPIKYWTHELVETLFKNLGI